ncbi:MULTISPECIES: HEXXH motif-containing putative peptide modification protein [Streptomyces]|uniref:HEXXH motif domain-containing protein n=1 Tax=Streptomyces koelreuteriae TaxID=2838015 RepID=A0ABX8FKW2_9ACTN|nr:MULTISPECIES: HEXXH motif-containing putative peptide modification protein [Streptomyces]QWB21752.1 HEXXH motif domain-containing protein [Streptomyces koelreuteriae]UUA04677.1 HEXXH motif-containing putative peptide modification protein [Streptomyces koelreuteriae]UUA12301.1 HEXXH motif-containing putative peptide modification protein [Streptomyces sp. CRCS-T-1]
MRPVPLRMPGRLFTAIATGGGGAEALELLARAEYSRRLACAHAVAEAARDIGGGVAETAGQAWELLAAAHRADPRAVSAVLTHPSAGTALIGLLARLDRVVEGEAGAAGELPVQRFSALAAAAAVRARVPARVRWRLTADLVFLPSLGGADFPGARPGDMAEVVVGADGAARVGVAGRSSVPGPVEVPPEPFAPAGRWRAAHRILVPDTGAPLLLDDIDPLRFPGVPERPLGLTTDDLRWWEATTREACDTLRSHHPVTYAELAAGPRTLVPLDSTGSFSGSSAEAFGSMALSRPRTGRGLALSMAHELQHSKFAALLHLFDLFESGGEERYYAPWRPDPRPLLGLFHGAYAHLGVTDFWNRRRAVERGPEELARAEAQFVRWRTGAREATEVLLTSGRLTPLGQRFARTMLDTLDGLCRLPVPAEARRRGQALAAEHRTEWVRRNGVPQALLI